MSFWSYSTQGPRWVWLPITEDGKHGVFDANKIFNVRAGPVDNWTTIDGQHHQYVITAPIKDVCAALSIPYVEEKKK